MQGTVKWFRQDKGYGFITSRSGEDHYFHAKAIQGAIPARGDKVSFKSEQNRKGLKATQVAIIEPANARHSPTHQKERNHTDDRINCPECAKKIVPRMITHRGEPQKSVCPYCAATVRKFSNCFIATAVYGDPCCPEVYALRKFRDESLLKHTAGKCFVAIYYKTSPPIARWLEHKPRLSSVIRASLSVIVKRLSKDDGNHSQ